MSESIEQHSLLLFFLLTIPLGWFWWIQMFLGLWPTELVIIPSSLGGASPILTVLIIEKLTKKKISLGQIFETAKTWNQRIPWLLMAAFLLPILVTAGNLLNGILVIESEIILLNPGPAELGYALIAIIPITFFAGLLSSPILEEPGWRGFALPRVQERFGREIGSLILGSYWWLWHQMSNISFGIYPSIQGYLFMVGMSFTFDSLFNLGKRNILVAMFAHSSSFIIYTYLYVTQSMLASFVVSLFIWSIVIVLRLLERSRVSNETSSE